MGQQSLAEFMGLHINIDQIFAENEKKQVKNKSYDDELLGSEKARFLGQLTWKTLLGREA